MIQCRGYSLAAFHSLAEPRVQNLVREHRSDSHSTEPIPVDYSEPSHQGDQHRDRWQESVDVLPGLPPLVVRRPLHPQGLEKLLLRSFHQEPFDWQRSAH